MGEAQDIAGKIAAEASEGATQIADQAKAQMTEQAQ